MRLPHWLRSLTARTPRPRQAARPARRPRLALEALEDRCLMAAGALDPTFGTGGQVTTSLVNNSIAAQAMAIQPNGDVVVAGGATDSSGNSPLMVGRYLPNGQLDSSFGHGGIVTTLAGTSVPFFQPYAAGADAVVIQPDGKIVVGGGASVATRQNLSDTALALLRYNPDGSLDTTFGNKGVVLTQLGHSGGENFSSLALQSDGKIVAAGQGINGLVVARYGSNGSLDSTFGQNGFFPVSSQDQTMIVTAVAIQPDGKIVAGGRSPAPAFGTQAELVRLNTNGVLDSTFGTGGRVVRQFTTASKPSSNVAGMAFQTVNGNLDIITAGTLSYQKATGTGRDGGLSVERFNPDGSLDASFGNGGVALTLNVSGGNAVVVQGNGDLLVSGNMRGSPSTGVVERLLPNGSMDSSYGTNGIAQTNVPGRYNIHAMALQPGGEVVIAGWALDSTSQHEVMVLERFLGDGAPHIGSFAASPNTVLAGSPVTLTAAGVVDANPAGTVTRVAFYLDSNGDGMLEPGTDTLLGYGTPNTDGTWTYTFTAPSVRRSYRLFAQAVDDQGVFGAPLGLTLAVQ